MGRPKGSKNKAKDNTPATIIDLPTARTATQPPPKPQEVEAEVEKAEEGDDVTRIKLCESRGIFGIIPHANRRYVTLVRRHYFEEETPTWSPRGGHRVQEAGSYGPWQLTKATYPRDVESALMNVANSLQNEFLDNDEAEDIRNVVAHIRAVKQEIIDHFKG